jgi:DNA-binding transcriptional MerR regulator
MIISAWRRWRRSAQPGYIAPNRPRTTTRALRFYEAQGLLAARRSANGYRDYGDDDLKLVTEILTLQKLGLSLDETRPFVECLRAGNEAGDVCPSSIEVYRRKLAEVDACLDRLSSVRADLVAKLRNAENREPSCQTC